MSRVQEQQAEEKRLRRLATTIWLALFFLVVLVIAHYIVFNEYYERSFNNLESQFWIPANKAVPFVVVGLMALVGSLIGLVGPGAISAAGFDVALSLRLIRVIVYALGVITAICLAFVCYYSGGTADSPFTPLLISYGFIAVVFARGRWTKLLFGFGPVLPYVLFYNQPHAVTAANRLPAVMFNDGWLPAFFNAGWQPVFFSTIVLIGTIVLAFLMARQSIQDASAQ